MYRGQTNLNSRFLLEEMEAMLSGTKKKRTVHAYVEQVQKPGSVMVWGCTSTHLHTATVMAALMQGSSLRF